MVNVNEEFDFKQSQKELNQWLNENECYNTIQPMITKTSTTEDNLHTYILKRFLNIYSPPLFVHLFVDGRQMTIVIQFHEEQIDVAKIDSKKWSPGLPM